MGEAIQAGSGEQFLEHRAARELAGLGVVDPAAEPGDPLGLDQVAPLVGGGARAARGLGEVGDVDERGHPVPRVVVVRPAGHPHGDLTAGAAQARHRPVADDQAGQLAPDERRRRGLAGHPRRLFGGLRDDPARGAQQRGSRRQRQRLCGRGVFAVGFPGDAEPSPAPDAFAPFGQQAPLLLSGRAPHATTALAALDQRRSASGRPTLPPLGGSASTAQGPSDTQRSDARTGCP